MTVSQKEACYECLLSFSNQHEATKIDRRLIEKPLLDLSNSSTLRRYWDRSWQEHYEWLENLSDSRSALERRLLAHLKETGRILPDESQFRIPETRGIPDFFYYPNVCVECDGSVHDTEDQRKIDTQKREALEALGYKVVAIRYDEDLEIQLRRNAAIFGEGV